MEFVRRECGDKIPVPFAIRLHLIYSLEEGTIKLLSLRCSILSPTKGISMRSIQMWPGSKAGHLNFLTLTRSDPTKYQGVPVPHYQDMGCTKLLSLVDTGLDWSQHWKEPLKIALTLGISSKTNSLFAL